MKRIILSALLLAVAADAGSYTITTSPSAVVVFQNTATGFTTRGHLKSITFTTQNGTQIVTVTVTP